MERIKINGKDYLKGYHTQEFRYSSSSLREPIKCKGANAWLGIGYYFWTEIEFAHYWGQDSKIKQTGFYDVYIANLDYENCINTVFDEEGYFFFREKIEETISHFENSGIEVSLEQVHRFLAENVWSKIGVEGIVYDDKPTNPRQSDRIYSAIPNLYFKKRIQIVLFSIKNICNFELLFKQQS